MKLTCNSDSCRKTYERNHMALNNELKTFFNSVTLYEIYRLHETQRVISN